MTENLNRKTKFIFITGGVVSSLGKGLASASLAAVLQARGFKVRLRKLDPYLNVDPGTMNPCQHGEVFVTDDGTEADLDLGHYERFSGIPATRHDSVTSGKIYQRVLDRERRGDYLGATIQVIPHVTNEIKSFILSDLTDEDFVLCEIGGTVGDIEGQPYLETIRQLAYELGRERTMFVHLSDVSGILVPGGFGSRGTEGKIAAVRYARENSIPWFGICFGMQMAVIETMRNIAGIKNAGSTELDPECEAVVGLMTEWDKDGAREIRSQNGDLGGTMRLGAYPCVLAPGSKAAAIYGCGEISERHRHRYEVNIKYESLLRKSGMLITGKSPDGKLPEIVERPEHPWFVGVQFHPELKSKPFAPHPLFVAFVKAAIDNSRLL